jgi:hypothetical protein
MKDSDTLCRHIISLATITTFITTFYEKDAIQFLFNIRKKLIPKNISLLSGLFIVL